MKYKFRNPLSLVLKDSRHVRFPGRNRTARFRLEARFGSSSKSLFRIPAVRSQDAADLLGWNIAPEHALIHCKLSLCHFDGTPAVRVRWWGYVSSPKGVQPSLPVSFMSNFFGLGRCRTVEWWICTTSKMPILDPFNSSWFLEERISRIYLQFVGSFVVHKSRSVTPNVTDDWSVVGACNLPVFIFSLKMVDW